jgi:hypothetical protein
VSNSNSVELEYFKGAGGSNTGDLAEQQSAYYFSYHGRIYRGWSQYRGNDVRSLGFGFVWNSGKADSAASLTTNLSGDILAAPARGRSVLLTGAKLSSLNTAGFVKTSAADGSLSVDTSTYLKVGNTLMVKSGANAMAGVFELNAGSATVRNTSVDDNSVIVLTVKTQAGARKGNPEIMPLPGIGFSAKGVVTDNSTYNYIILEVN